MQLLVLLQVVTTAAVAATSVLLLGGQNLYGGWLEAVTPSRGCCCRGWADKIIIRLVGGQKVKEREKKERKKRSKRKKERREREK